MSTMTIRNVPEELVGVLKKAAKRYRRSLNQQVLVCLEEASFGQGVAVNVEEDLRNIRAMRAGLAPMGAKRIDAAKREVLA